MGSEFNWRGIKRFNKGIILSLVGFCLLFLRDRADFPWPEAIISVPGYLLAIAGFIIAGSGMAHYWRDVSARDGKRDED